MQTITLLNGDSFELLKSMPDNSLSGVIVDPPYMIGFMNKDWDNTSDVIGDNEDDYAEEKDVHDIQLWHQLWLSEVFRCLKPGMLVKASAATRTQHRLAAAMEAVGFSIDRGHPVEAWVYGSGFTKSMNLSKAIDKRFGKTDDREVIGFSQGVGGENMNDIVSGREVVRTIDQPGGKGVGAYGVGAKQTQVILPVTVGATPEAKQFDGFGTSLKPSWEPFIVGRKPWSTE